MIGLFTVALASVVGLGSSAVPASAQLPLQSCVEEFGVTGGTQEFEVPAGVSEIAVDAWGAQGGDTLLVPGAGGGTGGGGLGAGVTGTVVAVNPGDQVELLVGGHGQEGVVPGPGLPGGFNGGGASGAGAGHQGGSGGGATNVSHNGQTLVIAGGGGGAGPHWALGGAGGSNGGDGTNPPGNANAGGQAGGSGGAAGTGGFTDGTAGSPGQGGDGGDADVSIGGSDGGAGGGGGVAGGGGAAGGIAGGNDSAGGGGGGSSMGQPTSAIDDGVKQGDGFVRVTYQSEDCGVPDTCVEEFGLTGDDQTWEVPEFVDEIFVDAYGAEGGGVAGQPGFLEPILGGRGAGVLGTVVAVAPGDQIEMIVGGAGAGTNPAFNGGGIGGLANAHNGRLGGGSTDVLHNGQTVVIAGGGGGAAHGSENGTGGRGGAGGLVGKDGMGAISTGNALPGLGATTTAGGAGGAGSTFLTPGGPGTAGSAGQGGTGGAAAGPTYVPDSDGGGGGGGGVFGGGAGGGGDGGLGSGAGAGGGSSMGQPTSSFETGVRDGDGLVRVTYQLEGCGVADLAIGKTAPATVAAGGQITWTMTITNNGPEDSTGSTVTDAIPAGITNAATSTAGCSVAAGTLTCAVGPLAVGASTQVVLTGTAPSAGGVCVTNSASVDGDQLDPNESNNSATATTCTPPPPPPASSSNVTVDKTASTPNAIVGDTVTYTIVATNSGPATATGVTVSDPIPSRLDARSASAAQGTCTVTGNDVACALGTLTVGQSVRITVRAVAERTGGTTNTASVRSNECTATPCDTDPADVRIRKPRLRLTKKVSKRTLTAGDTTRYTIRVRNPSKVRLRNVRVCDRLPSGLVYVSSKPKAKVSKGKECWTVRRLAAGKSKTFRLTVRASSSASGRKVNRVTATSPDARTARAKRAVRVIGGQALPRFTG